MKKIFLFAGLLLTMLGDLSAQCLVLPNCPTALLFCDSSFNDAELWHDSTFFDFITYNTDLGEVATDLSMQITDNCGTGNIQASFVLLLDLDSHGSRETAITSAALPVAGTVFFDNAANPNYTGGVARPFDLRPVPADQKYGFALEQSVQGNVLTFRVRWTTAASPNVYLPPQLPYGLHRIEWRFEKGGQVITCAHNFLVKDCQPPSVVCQDSVIVNLPPAQYTERTVSDFLQSAIDNNTLLPALEYGLRRSGMGTGFPVDNQGHPVTKVTFSCLDLGAPQPVELWAIDQAGNAGYCETFVTVTDNDTVCQSVNTTIEACVIDHCDGLPIADVHFELTGTHPVYAPVHYDLGVSGADGCAPLLNTSMPPGTVLRITPSKAGDPLEGVDTHDMLTISQHILGVQSFDNPYKTLAADVDRSGLLTGLDLVRMRELILGQSASWPNNITWRFVDTSVIFGNPNDPFNDFYVPTDIVQADLHKRFYAIKLGDVDCSASQPIGPLPEELLALPDWTLPADDTIEVPVWLVQADNRFGFQFGLQFDPAQMQVLAVIPEIGNQNNYAVFPDGVKASWYQGGFPTAFSADQPVCRLRIKTLVPLHLAEAFHLDTVVLHAETYFSDDIRKRLQLQFTTVATTEPHAREYIFDPQPNPTAAGVCIPLRLEETAVVLSEILDATGRLIYRREQAAGGGSPSIEIPASVFPQPGVYFWRVQVGAAFRSGKIVKR